MKQKSITGQYNTKVTLQFPSGTTSQGGIEKANYLDGATIWASFDVRPPKGREIYATDAINAISTRWIKIRYIAGIESTWRVKYGTKTFDIASPPIDTGMLHRELLIELKAVD